ncbi:MAG: CarD family transcriptional regulator [Holosporales bacterium]|jgi:CarD family transcriptional regulator|nr:CarD family transcriptional regulator [Holosporales bacterium]
MTADKKFRIGSWVVYPSHGVGKLDDVESFEINGETIEFFVISFPKNKLILKLPIKKAIKAGLRQVADRSGMQSVFDILSQRTRKKRLVWSKRAQEYETKINSGDLRALAEVVRELYREGKEAAQSFSERQIYQNALERLAREMSVIEDIEEPDAIKKLEIILQAA